MTDKNLTCVCILLDRSGSMEQIRADTIGGFNAFLREQKNGPGECRLTLVQFDSQGVETIYDYMPIGAAAELTAASFKPRAETPLLDAIAMTIKQLGSRLEAIPESTRPGVVIFAIITDGLENASHRYGRHEVKLMREHQEKKYGWKFVYLGANQNAIEVAETLLGINARGALTYDVHNVGATYSNLASNVTRARNSGASGQAVSMDWSPAERQSSAAGQIVVPTNGNKTP